MVYMLILVGGAAEEVENATVTVLEAFAPWYDFLEGW